MEGGAKPRYKPPFASIAQRSSATTSGAARLIALGLNAKGSNIQASRLSNIDNSIGQELDQVDLRFENLRDKIGFVAAFNALKDPHEDFDEAKTSLTRKFEWDEWELSDGDDVITPAKQTSANAELKPLHKVKAGQVDSSAPFSQPRRGLAVDPTNHPDGRADIVPLVAASLDSKFRSQQFLGGNSMAAPRKYGNN